MGEGQSAIGRVRTDCLKPRASRLNPVRYSSMRFSRLSTHEVWAWHEPCCCLSHHATCFGFCDDLSGYLHGHGPDDAGSRGSRPTVQCAAILIARNALVSGRKLQRRTCILRTLSSTGRTARQRSQTPSPPSGGRSASPQQSKRHLEVVKTEHEESAASSQAATRGESMRGMRPAERVAIASCSCSLVLPKRAASRAR